MALPRSAPTGGVKAVTAHEMLPSRRNVQCHLGDEVQGAVAADLTLEEPREIGGPGDDILLLVPADALQGQRGSHDVLTQRLARGLVEDAGSTLDREPGVLPARYLSGEVGIQQALVEKQGDDPAAPDLGEGGGSPKGNEYVPTPRAEDNNAVMCTLPPGSLVVNATGLGKDGPGSPITDAAPFPERGFAWDFNYRGDLLFLEQARRQAATKRLHVEDGWLYFIHGWLAVIADVFHRDIPTSGPVFDDLCRIAGCERRPESCE
jgi:hypothetical protein